MKAKNTKAEYIAAKQNIIEFYNKTSEFLSIKELDKNINPNVIQAKKNNLVVIHEFIRRTLDYVKYLEAAEKKESAIADNVDNKVVDYVKLLDKSIPNEREALREYSKSNVRMIWPELF